MLTKSLRGRDFISLRDFSKHEIVTILETALALKADYGIGRPHKVLDGRTLFMLFFNPSMRTRNSFEAGMFQLGGMPIFWSRVQHAFRRWRRRYCL